MTQLTEDDIRTVVTNALADSLPEKRLDIEEFVQVRETLVQEFVRIT